MSYLTDAARAPSRALQPDGDVPANNLDAILAANPGRREVLRSSVGLLGLFGMGSMLSGCGDDDTTAVVEPPPVATPTPAPQVSFAVTFRPVAENLNDTVTVPEGYVAETLFVAGDPVLPGAKGFDGNLLTVAQGEAVAGGNHDGMHYFAIPGTNPQNGGLLAINHEFPDVNLLFADGRLPSAATATAEQKALALSAVGVSVIEVQRASDGKWSVKRDSQFNRRITGNTIFRMSGPATSLTGASARGTLNNCGNGYTPWGTYLTCEETTDNYLDPTQPALGYGWTVEIDPQGQIIQPTKRTAMGRFDHENVDFLLGSDNRVAFYQGDDSTPGCIYKFVPTGAVSTANRAANADLLDSGILYVARFNADSTGEWRALVQGQNGLVVGATDPGNTSQGPQTPRTVNFATQADVLVETKAAARVAGGTVMDRPEWVTVAPDKNIYITLTNNSGRQVTDAANPRVQNRHGHILRFKETGDSPTATTFTWSIVLLAGDPSLANATGNLTGNISGDTFSSPDGLRVDPQGRLWAQTDMSVPGNSGVTGQTNEQVFGNNAMYYLEAATRKSSRFLVGPVGQEITGIAYTPDLTTFFINVQHPTGAWPEAGKPARSATIVVRRTDGRPVGN
jgi:uncharacterized protein